MKCYECGETIINKKCSCSVPRPIPSGSRFKTRQEYENSIRDKQISAIKNALIALSVCFGVSMILIAITLLLTK